MFNFHNYFGYVFRTYNKYLLSSKRAIRYTKPTRLRRVLVVDHRVAFHFSPYTNVNIVSVVLHISRRVEIEIEIKMNVKLPLREVIVDDSCRTPPSGHLLQCGV